jgi:hypothetical protein
MNNCPMETIGINLKVSISKGGGTVSIVEFCGYGYYTGSSTAKEMANEIETAAKICSSVRH